MAEKCFEGLLSDDQMLAQLRRGEAFVFKLGQWQAVERQIERLGFDSAYVVCLVESLQGKLTKVTPAEHTQARRGA